MSAKTLYQVLRVKSSATTTEIKKAFRELARTHHPDTGGTAASFRQVHEAYQILSKPSSRKLYDLEINAHASHRPASHQSTAWRSSGATQHSNATQGKGWTMKPGGFNVEEWERGHGLGRFSGLHKDIDIGSVSGFANKNTIHIINHKLDTRNLNKVQQFYRRKDQKAAQEAARQRRKQV